MSISNICKCDCKEAPFTYKTIVLKPNWVNGKNVLTQAMMSEGGTKYVIKWDFDLDNATISVPGNSILEFDGGVLRNGTIIGLDTYINNVGGVDRIFGEGIDKQGTWRENQCEDCVKRGEFDALMEAFLELKAKVDRYHPEPVPPPETKAFAGFVVKPTAEDIASVVDVTASKPTEGYEIDGSAFIGPTDYYLAYPLSWEKIEDEVMVNPVVVDSNGFEMGAYPDSETPTVLVEGVTYRITYVGLGKGVFTVYFNR